MSTGPSFSSSPPTSPAAGVSFGSLEQQQKAIEAMRNKNPVPDTDFTLHVMEDGTEVSTQERVCKGTWLPIAVTCLLIPTEVQAPAFSRPSDEQFFDPQDPSKPNISFLKNHFYREGRLTEEQALYIIRAGTEILRREPNVLEVDAPITGSRYSLPL
jgi:serine/threonine-protein phosphatase 2B catalytic subunit